MANKFQVPSSLTLEPNPFEQSFAGKTDLADTRRESLPETPHLQQRLPGVQGLTSPAPLMATPGQWQAPRLSPAILTGPDPTGMSGIPVQVPQPLGMPPPHYQQSLASPGVLLDKREYKVGKRSARSKLDMAGDDEKKRSDFLERNRLAAVKCRQRKKQWVDNLKGKVDYYQGLNDELSSEVARLKGSLDQVKQYLYSIQDPRQMPPQIITILEGTLAPSPPRVSSSQIPQNDYQNVPLMAPQMMMGRQT